MAPDLIELFARDSVRWNITQTIVLIVIVFGFRGFGLLATKRLAESAPEARRRWSVLIRNASVGVLIFVTTIIWRHEIRDFAISLVAVAAAFAIATKEGILCFVGGMLRVANNLYTVGDRIEIGTARGDVIDHNLLTTKLLEVGPQRDMHVYTGRTIVVPNSLLLTVPVLNESSHEYVLHVFKIPLGSGEDWRVAESLVLEAARTECAPYLEGARARLQAIIKDHGLDSFSVDPRVSLHLGDHEKVSLVVRIPALNKKKAGMEQSILRTYLEAKKALSGGAAQNGERRVG